jgi:signal transduction histidine kinase/CheY-like chemotaxis protein
VIVGFFLFLKFYLYGDFFKPSAFMHSFSLYLLGAILSLALVLRQNSIYEHILKQPAATIEKKYARYILQIAFNKALYMIPWLLFIFQPLHYAYLYDHLLGYFFVFCTVTLYASISAVCFPLFLWDIIIPLGGALAVTALNVQRPETPYIVGVVGALAFYTMVNGYKIMRTTGRLINSGHDLEKTARSADDANVAKSEFLAMMSHEIRTPMTGILGMVEMLSESDLTEEQKLCLETISESSKTLLNTLNDILDLSKIEAKKLSVNPVNFDLQKALKNNIRMAEPAAAVKEVSLELAVAEDVPRYIYADPHRIQQALTNLLNNALKFTEKGSVIVRVSRPRQNIRIEVIDSGIGISPEKQKRLFKRFSQTDSSIARKYGGSGLGLSITKELVELMGGKIGVKSQPNVGSHFWFEIPYQPPVAETSSSAEKQILPDLPPLHILLVEDHPINQALCSKLLTKKGHHVTVAGNGTAALKLLQKERYDIILMDCNLPVKDGFQTTKEIRAMGGRHALTPIIALTANAMEGHVKKCYDAGMNDCIIKPFSTHRFYEALVNNSGRAVPPSSAPHSNKLQQLAAELGADYMNHFVKTSLQETAHLIQKISESAANRDFQTVRLTAHDLVAVSGAIDLVKIREDAEKIEKCCIDTQYAPILPLVAELIQLGRSAAEDVKKNLA